MQYIPLILVLIGTLISIIICLFENYEIKLSLKILSIVIILFYIIGNIVKIVLTNILNMEKQTIDEDDTTEDGRADEHNTTSDKSGDDFEE